MLNLHVKKKKSKWNGSMDFKKTYSLAGARPREYFIFMVEFSKSCKKSNCREKMIPPEEYGKEWIKVGVVYEEGKKERLKCCKGGCDMF